MRHTATLFALLLVLAGVPATGAGVPASTAQQDACEFPHTATDATGTEVTVEERPERIVALQASSAQILWEIGAADRVVGMPVRPFTAYLNGSESRTDVLTEDGSGVDVEQVVALEPDLVIAPELVPNDTVSQLRSAGVTVFKFDADKSIRGIYEKTGTAGRLVGNCAAANETVEETRSTVQRIESAVEGRERPDALYYFYNFTAGNGTFIDEILTTAGGDNVAAQAGISGYREISDEVVAERNPDWLLHPSDAPLPRGEPFASTTAYRQNQTLSVNASYMNQAAPRVVIPMEEIARALHPEAFGNATESVTGNVTGNATGGNDTNGTSENGPSENGTAAANESTAASAGDGSNGSGEQGATSGAGPGFGVVAAVVALLATALLARRS